MQDFTSPTMMSPYAQGVTPPLGGSNNPEPPRLGPSIPGTTGGLPSQSGLSVFTNPMSQTFQGHAQMVQGQGRGNDSMLVHMTPEEVNSLRGLAQRFGGDLTTNPSTGLPEAGWLGNLLPTILGVAGGLVGLPTWALALGGLGAGTALTGDIGKGVMMGLQAYGGGALGGALGGAGAATGAASAAADIGSQAATDAATNAATTAATGAATNTAAGLAHPGLLSQFSTAAKAGLPGFLQKVAPYAAGYGLLSGVTGALQPGLPKAPVPDDPAYNGPYRYKPRTPTFYSTPDLLSSSAERTYFSPEMPTLIDASGNPVYPNGGYAKGGEVHLQQGGFVMPARETAEFGNGSSTAGQRTLAGLGGIPIRGAGDGVSDSIPANIGGSQKARMATDEVYFPPHAVNRIGNGDSGRGTSRLLGMLKQARDARKSAGVGADSRLRSIL